MASPDPVANGAFLWPAEKHQLALLFVELMGVRWDKYIELWLERVGRISEVNCRKIVCK